MQTEGELELIWNRAGGRRAGGPQSRGLQSRGPQVGALTHLHYCALRVNVPTPSPQLSLQSSHTFKRMLLERGGVGVCGGGEDANQLR